MKHEHRITMVPEENHVFSKAEMNTIGKYLQIALIESFYQKGFLTHIEREACLGKLGADPANGVHP